MGSSYRRWSRSGCWTACRRRCFRTRGTGNGIWSRWRPGCRRTCGHIWDDLVDDWFETTSRWTHRGHALISFGLETDEFSAARLFAAVYPEAVDLAQLIASPAWRSLAAGDADQQ